MSYFSNRRIGDYLFARQVNSSLINKNFDTLDYQPTWASTFVPLVSSQTTLCLVSLVGDVLPSVSLTTFMTFDLLNFLKFRLAVIKSSGFCFFDIGRCLFLNQFDGAIMEAAVAFEEPGSLPLAPWRIDTSKLFERKLLSRFRFCSVVLPDQLDLLSSCEIDASSPHRLISVAEDVKEFRIDIRSVLEQTMPAAPETLTALGSSEARLRREEVGDTEGIGISENRLFWCCVYRWAELFPSKGWISHTCSVGVLYIFSRTWDKLVFVRYWLSKPRHFYSTDWKIQIYPRVSEPIHVLTYAFGFRDTWVTLYNTVVSRYRSSFLT